MNKLLFVLITIIFLFGCDNFPSSEDGQIKKSQQKVETLITAGENILIATENYRNKTGDKFATNFEELTLQLGKDFKVYPGYVQYEKGNDRFLFLLDYSGPKKDLLLVANYSQTKNLYDAFQLVISKNYKETPAKITAQCKAPINWKKSCEVCRSVGNHTRTGDWCWYNIK